MKKCIRCGETKPTEEFYWANKASGKRRSDCKTCRKAHRSERWANGSEKESNYAAKARRVERAREYIWSLFQKNSCADCGEANPVVFEFDHTGTDKFMSVAQMVSQNYGLESIKREIAKCEIVCANCHKIRTSMRGNHWRISR